uniref:Uncharacterized protein n=1 Tax=Ditylenchus dipsaci TaxID=166011 RepID=A0A915CPA4_9BILA
MVLAMQAEKNVTSSGIILHVASVWIALRKYSVPENNSKWCVAIAQAAMECFDRKIGDLSDEWLNRISGKLNKEVVVFLLVS